VRDVIGPSRLTKRQQALDNPDLLGTAVSRWTAGVPQIMQSRLISRAIVATDTSAAVAENCVYQAAASRVPSVLTKNGASPLGGCHVLFLAPRIAPIRRSFQFGRHHARLEEFYAADDDYCLL
jgi:hypothetical protein